MWSEMWSKYFFFWNINETYEGDSRKGRIEYKQKAINFIPGPSYIRTLYTLRHAFHSSVLHVNFY